MSKRLISIFPVITLIIWSCGGTTPAANPAPQKAQPQWLVKYPVSPDYYVGIGSASRTQLGSDAMKSAQDMALSDLASQISVSINSEIVSRLIEKGSITEEEFKASARSQTAADLEGHELVDTWQDDSMVYVYYRLSKAKYAEIQARKRQSALDLSKSAYLKAQAAREQGNFSAAMRAALQGFGALIPYLDEALEVDLNGRSLIISNALFEQIQTYLTEIELQVLDKDLKGKLGQPLSSPVRVKASWGDGMGARDVPLRIHFKKGDGVLTDAVSTGSNAQAQIKVFNIASGEKLQVLEIALDQDQLLGSQASALLTQIIKGTPPARTQALIDVVNPTIYLESSELFNGNALKQKQIEPRLKNHLVQAGFQFVDQASKADWQMELQATAFQGTAYSGLYTVFADVSLSVMDRSNGNEIYKNSLKRIKGIDLNYDTAANKALSNAAEQLNETMLPEIMESLK